MDFYVTLFVMIPYNKSLYFFFKGCMLHLYFDNHCISLFKILTLVLIKQSEEQNNFGKPNLGSFKHYVSTKEGGGGSIVFLFLLTREREGGITIILM